MTGMMRLLAAICIASTAVAADNPSVASACGSEDAKFQVRLSEYPAALPKPQAGSALVYVIEDQVVPVCRVGCVETARIGLDGSWVGANRFDSWLSFEVKPGEHHLCIDLQGKGRGPFDPKRVSLARFTADVGATYYFIARVTHTAYVGPWVDLQPANRDEGAFLVYRHYPSSSRRQN